MIKIKGHSNFEVKTEVYNNEIIIIKSAKKEDKNRLIKQIEKQKYIFNNNFLLNCKIPRIIKRVDSNYISFYMEYIHNSINLIDFLQIENTLKINWLVKCLINIIESYINRCTTKIIDKSILLKKIQDTNYNIINKSVCNSNEVKKYFDFLKDNLDEIRLPVGICHGDLTFSNILIDTNNMNLYLIDFLDNFIESPLFDIIKIRQDTKYFWSLKLCDFQYDKNKVKLTLNFIDNKIHEYFNKYSWYNKHYKYFQILNLLRILQYCKDNEIKEFLIEKLDKLII
jgi:serine/threonine protein kinase